MHKILLRLPDELAATVKKMAAARGVSVNTVIVRSLERVAAGEAAKSKP